jgi:hypothetical protein
VNIPAIKNPVVRRLHLLWVIPYLIVMAPLHVVYQGCKEVLPCLPSFLSDVWTGRR